MTKITCEHKNNYTIINNSILVDPRLQILDRLLLILLLSLPGNWDYSNKGLAKLLRKSPDTIGASTQRLENLGFIEKKEQKRKDGQFARCDWLIYEDASLNPKCSNTRSSSSDQIPTPINSTTVKSSSDYSPQINNKESKESKTKETSTAGEEFIFEILNDVAADDQIKGYIADSVKYIFNPSHKKSLRIKYLNRYISLHEAQKLYKMLTRESLNTAVELFINASESGRIRHPSDYMRTLLLIVASDDRISASSAPDFLRFSHRRKYDYEQLERDALGGSGSLCE